MTEVARLRADPVGDEAATRDAGLLQKYAGRVLLITTGTCAIHCRYCFRRHFPYDETPRSLADGSRRSTRSPATRRSAKSSSAAAIR